jgi:hypothetical protein
MKNLFAAFLTAFSLVGYTASPVTAYDLEIEDYFTNGSMGCMMMRECTKDVVEVKDIIDVENYQNKNHSFIKNEFNALVNILNDVGVNVYIAPQHYFLIGTRGVYYTEGNDIFLNADMTKRSSTLMSVLRHEGWHTAQDCMAGDIENNFIAIVFPEERVPKVLQELAKNTYKDPVRVKSVVWEKEAYMAGHTEGMTQEALEVCSKGNMWETYEPTPLTKQFLVEKGYMKE